jgi:hypothetical protein
VAHLQRVGMGVVIQVFQAHAMTKMIWSGATGR